MLEKVKEVYKLKKELSNHNISMEKYLSKENSTDYEKRIIIENLFNNRFHFMEILYNLKEQNKIDFLLENIEEIEDIDTLLQVYVFLSDINATKEKEIVRKKIKNKLKNTQKVLNYLIEWLLYFCNDNNLEFSYYSNLLLDDRYFIETELNLCFEDFDLITINEKKDNKYYYNINLNKSKVFNNNNPLHIKNILKYLKLKGWSSDRNTDYTNQTHFFEFLELEQVNILKLFKEEKINFDIGRIFFSNTLEKFRWLNKENYENYRLIYSYDLRKNNNMTNIEKIEFIENVLSNVQYKTNDYYILDIIDLLKKEPLDILLLNPKISEIIVSEYIENYEEKKVKWKSLYRTNYDRHNEGDRWDEQTTLDSKDSIVYYIKETAFFYERLKEKIKTTTSMNEKMSLLRIVNDIPKKIDRRKIYKESYETETIIYLLDLKYEIQQSIYGKSINIKEILDESQKILELMVEDLTSNFDKMLIFVEKFKNFSYKNKVTKKYLEENMKKVLEKRETIENIVFAYNKNLISKEEKEERLINKLILKYSKAGYFHNENIQNIEDIEQLLLKSSPSLKFDILWLYWKEKDKARNIEKLIKSTQIFDLLNDNTIELLSNKRIIEKLVKEPFSSYDDFGTSKKVEFIKTMIEYNKNTTMWNIIQEMAKEMEIKVLPELKEELYYTNEHLLEDIFEI